MTTSNPLRSPGANEPRSSAEKLEQDALLAGVAAAAALRAVEVGAIVLLGLLVCPPLAILAVVVAVSLLVAALVLGVLAAVVSTPYLLVHHLSPPAHRLRRPARALIDLAPQRIVAGARKVAPGR